MAERRLVVIVLTSYNDETFNDDGTHKLTKLALKGSYNLNQNTVNYQKEVENGAELISVDSAIERLNKKYYG